MVELSVLKVLDEGHAEHGHRSLVPSSAVTGPAAPDPATALEPTVTQLRSLRISLRGAGRSAEADLLTVRDAGGVRVSRRGHPEHRHGILCADRAQRIRTESRSRMSADDAPTRTP